MSDKPLTKEDLAQVEKFADKLFAKIGIDVEFTKHFVERANDGRNKKQVTTAELIRLFKKVFQKHKKKLADLPSDFEAVLKDLNTNINTPFVLKYDRRKGEMEMVMKTIMRKKDFKTPDPELKVESFKDWLRGEELSESADKKKAFYRELNSLLKKYNSTMQVQSNGMIVFALNKGRDGTVYVKQLVHPQSGLKAAHGVDKDD